MHMTQHQTARATRCLWSLQEHDARIVGLLMSHVDGLTLTSTMEGSDSTQRLAAVSTAMFLLSEEASENWGRGDSIEVAIKLAPESSGSYHYVYMKPIGYRAVLLAVCQSDHIDGALDANLDKAVRYLQAVMNGDTPDAPRWL